MNEPGDPSESEVRGVRDLAREDLVLSSTPLLRVQTLSEERPNDKPLVQENDVANSNHKSTASHAGVNVGNADRPRFNLIGVDTHAGAAVCRAATRRQWATIIQNAKNRGNIPGMFKEAKFHYFGTVKLVPAKVKDNIPRDGTNMLQAVFHEVLNETSLNATLIGHAIPLAEHAELPGRTKLRRLSADPMRSGRPSNQQALTGLIEPLDEPMRVHHEGHDFGFMDRSAAELYNDSELVIGQGVVRINQQPHVEAEVQEKAAKLSPESFGRRNLDYKLDQYVIPGQVFRTDSEQGNFPLNVAIEKVESLIMRWSGKTELAIKILKNEITTSYIPFTSVINIKYSDNHSLLFTFTTAENEKIEEILVILSPVSPETWQVLKSCCYTITNRRNAKGYSTDREIQEVFDQKAKALVSQAKTIVHRPLPQTAERRGMGAYIMQMPGRPFQKPIFQPTTPAEYTPSRASKPNKRVTEKTDDEDSEEVEEQVAKRPRVVKRQSTSEDSAAKSIYYKPVSKADTLIEIQIGDMVVRRRTGEECSKGGRGYGMDVFDGPWRILKFDAKRVYGVKPGLKNLDEISKADRDKMYTTKVHLNFPKESKAKNLVEIIQLIPVLDATTVMTGKLEAFSMTVAEMPGFKLLKDRIHGLLDTAAQISGESKTVVANEKIQELYLVELYKDKFAAVIEVLPQSVGDGDTWEVEKLRNKRLRLYPGSSKIVKVNKLKPASNDPWVQSIEKQHPALVKGKVLIAEYRVHWAGWPDEDDTWEMGHGLPPAFIDEYHRIWCPFRNTGPDVEIDPFDVIFLADAKELEKVKKALSKPESKEFAMDNNLNSDETNRYILKYLSDLPESGEYDSESGDNLNYLSDQAELEEDDDDEAAAADLPALISPLPALVPLLEGDGASETSQQREDEEDGGSKADSQQREDEEGGGSKADALELWMLNHTHGYRGQSGSTDSEAEAAAEARAMAASQAELDAQSYHSSEFYG